MTNTHKTNANNSKSDCFWDNPFFESKEEYDGFVAAMTNAARYLHLNNCGNTPARKSGRTFLKRIQHIYKPDCLHNKVLLNSPLHLHCLFHRNTGPQIGHEDDFPIYCLAS